jgi:hypothetical protein
VWLLVEPGSWAEAGVAHTGRASAIISMLRRAIKTAPGELRLDGREAQHSHHDWTRPGLIEAMLSMISNLTLKCF